MLQNDFLMQLFQGGAIDVKTMLENSSYPFAAKLLEGIKRDEAEAQQALQQYPPQSAQMAMALNNENASAMDGVIRRA